MIPKAKRLVPAQRKLELQKKGSSEREKAKKIVTKVQEGIMFKRTDSPHQESIMILKQYGQIFVKNMHVIEMITHGCLKRNIRDAA